MWKKRREKRDVQKKAELKRQWTGGGERVTKSKVKLRHEAEGTTLTFVPQNKEGILPVATLSIALYILRRYMSASDVTPEVTSLLSAS